MPQPIRLLSALFCSTLLLPPTTIIAAEPAVADHREIVLWPDGVPEPRVPSDPAETVEIGKDALQRRANVSNPRLVVYALPQTADARLRSAVIVLPGGGFNILADGHEGTDICRWLNQQGIVAFTLLYRVPTGQLPVPNAGPVMDAQKAVYEVRRRATEFGIDPARIGLLGFSAGAHAALVAATSQPSFTRDDASVSTRANSTLLIYPWQVLNPEGKSLWPGVTVDGSTTPMFIAQAGDDMTSPAKGAATLYLALLEAKVPTELHIYERGGHGYGMRQVDKAPGTSDWPARALDWLRARGF